MAAKIVFVRPASCFVLIKHYSHSHLCTVAAAPIKILQIRHLSSRPIFCATMNKAAKDFKVTVKETECGVDHSYPLGPLEGRSPFDNVSCLPFRLMVSPFMLLFPFCVGASLSYR
jgi:hypothetical protein